MQRPTSLSAAGLARLAPVLGLSLGIGIVVNHPLRTTPGWPVWAVLALALTTTAGAVAVYGLERWAELAALHVVRVRTVARPVLAIVALALLLLVAYLPLAAGSYGWSWHAGGLVIITVLGGAPAVGVMYGIRQATNATPALDPKGAQVVVLIALRQLLQRLLAALGSLVALSTLALGAGLAMRRQLPPGVRVGGITGLPPEAVVVFGAVGSTLVALVYGPVSAALRRRGEDLCDQLFPLSEASQPADILDQAENRQKLAQLLGTDRGLVAELQSSLAILGPLLASAAATFLPD